MDHKLPDEKTLIDAEQTLHLWASILADAGLDRDAADALRLEGEILRFRGGFLAGDKA